MGTKKRNSSIELLKLISIILIVLSHAAASAPIATKNGGDLVLLNSLKITITNLGQIGNCIFFVSSVWLLLESYNVKINKAIKMIVESFCTSVFCLAIVLLAGYNIPLKEIVFSFFPLTFGFYWFISCYILIYLIHPYINYVIEKLSQFQLFCIVSSFVLLYSVYVLILGGDYFYYNELIGFLSLYFITAYFKKYSNNKLSSKKLCILILLPSLLWIIGSVFLAILAANVASFSNKSLWLNKFINPCFVAIALGLVSFANKRKFYLASINYLSSLTLIVFMLHNNKLVRTIVEIDFYNKIFLRDGFEFWIPAVLMYFGISIILSFGLSFILGKIFNLYLFNRFIEYIALQLRTFFLKTFYIFK